MREQGLESWDPANNELTRTLVSPLQPRARKKFIQDLILYIEHESSRVTAERLVHKLNELISDVVLRVAQWDAAQTLTFLEAFIKAFDNHGYLSTFHSSPKMLLGKGESLSAYPYLKQLNYTARPQLAIALGSLSSQFGSIKESKNYLEAGLKICKQNYKKDPCSQSALLLGIALRNASVNISGRRKMKYRESSSFLLSAAKDSTFIASGKFKLGIGPRRKKIVPILQKYLPRSQELVIRKEMVMRVLPKRNEEQGQLSVSRQGLRLRVEFKYWKQTLQVTLRMTQQFADEFLDRLCIGIEQIGEGLINGRFQNFKILRSHSQLLVYRLDFPAMRPGQAQESKWG